MYYDAPACVLYVTCSYREIPDAYVCSYTFHHKNYMPHECHAELRTCNRFRCVASLRLLSLCETCDAHMLIKQCAHIRVQCVQSHACLVQRTMLNTLRIMRSVQTGYDGRPARSRALDSNSALSSKGSTSSCCAYRGSAHKQLSEGPCHNWRTCTMWKYMPWTWQTSGYVRF